MKNIIIALTLAAAAGGVSPAFAYDEDQGDKDFVQSLIQSKDYTCNEVESMVVSSYSGKISVLCVGVGESHSASPSESYSYTITKPGGRWQVESND